MDDPLVPIDPPPPVWTDPTLVVPPSGAGDPTQAGADPPAAPPQTVPPPTVPPPTARPAARPARPARPTAHPARRRHLPSRPSVSPVVVTVAVVIGVMVLMSFCSTGLQSLL